MIFLDRLWDKAPQPVNLQPCGADVFVTPSRSDGVWTALRLYHNAGHKHIHLRTSLLAFISVHLR